VDQNGLAMNSQLVIATRPHRGIILLIVMLVIVMISLAGLSYVWTLSTENKAVRLRGDELQLEATLASAQEYVRAVCATSWQERLELGGLSENETLFRNAIVDCDAEGTLQAHFSVLAPQADQAGTGGYRYGLQDESTKLNLAALRQWDQANPGAAEQALSGLPGMTEAVAAAIMDWIDTDTTPRSSGAEAEYYTAQRLPYVPRDGIPATLEELLLVRDVSRYQLFGADTDRNYQIDTREQQAATASPAGGGSGNQLPWADMLTVHSAERNVTCAGQERINVNQSDLRQLQERLSEVFEDAWVTFIIAYRQFGPLDAESPPPPLAERVELGQRPGRSSSLNRLEPREQRASFELDLELPAEFPVESLYDLIGAEILLPAPEQRQQQDRRSRGRSSRYRSSAGPLEDEGQDSEPPPPQILISPFAADPSRMGQYLPQLLDQLKLDDEEVIRGRINLRQAPREVLAAIPELEPDVVDRILAVRDSQDNADPAAVRHLVWLLADEVIDLDQMRRLSAHVTGGGDVFRGQVAAMLGGSQRIARAELVIDATADPPRQLYWKNLGMLGPGFAPDVVSDAAGTGSGVAASDW
jgi:hypothetical protein